MTYVGPTTRAYELVKQFVVARKAHDIPPDVIYYLEGSMDPVSPSFGQVMFLHDGGDLDGWTVAVWNGRCIIGLSDGTVLEGQLKLRSKLFRRSRHQASSYGYWSKYSDTKILLGAVNMTDDLANAIIAVLETTE